MTAPATTDYINGPVDDQLEMYDQSIVDWVTADFGALLPGKTAQVLIATPHRAYMEVVTGDMILDQTRLSVPRIAITRGDYTRDASRFNPNTIRALGRVAGSVGLYKRYQEKYPSPLNIPYQIDFWTEFGRDMNLWAQKFLYEFTMGYKYLSITPDAMWGEKKYFLSLESPLQDTSELEPQEQYREIRRTVNLMAQGRLYGQHPAQVPAVKRILIGISTTSTEGPDDSVLSPNRRQTLYTSPGGQTVFTGGVLGIVRVLEDTFVLSAYFDGVERVAQDDGAGHLFGPNVASGSINYDTGAVDITYTTAPDAGPLGASWLTDQGD